MSSLVLEAFLARIYVDQHARESFISDPRTEAFKAGLSHDEVEAVCQIDELGLELFANSLAIKREGQHSKGHRRNFF